MIKAQTNRLLKSLDSVKIVTIHHCYWKARQDHQELKEDQHYYSKIEISLLKLLQNEIQTEADTNL